MDWSDEVRARLTQATVGNWIDGCWVADICAALGEIERLWEALDDIATGYWCRKYGASVTAREFARAALRGGEK